MELARNEHENAQILLTTADDKKIENGYAVISALHNEKGEPFSGTLSWRRAGYLSRERGFFPHPCSPPLFEKWFPDPLLPAGRFSVPCGGTQSLWLDVHAGKNASKGIYRGHVSVYEGGTILSDIPLTVRVRDFSQPDTFGMPTAFSVMDGFTRAKYKTRFEKMKRESWDIMLEHRLNPDDISRTLPPAIEDLIYARSRGMNRFNILNIVPEIKDSGQKWSCYAEPEVVFSLEFYEEFKARVVAYVEELKKHGLENMAYLYGFDERRKEYYKGIDIVWNKLKRDVPGVPLMTTAMMYHDMQTGKTNYPCLKTSDWFCPLTQSYSPQLSEHLRKEGKQVWWYVSCYPAYPYANFSSYEYPLIEGRLLSWFTYLYSSDGLLYWHVNYWGDELQPLLDEKETYFPSWHTASSLNMPGDGILLYPCKGGIVPSMRLAQIRDGIEDYERLQILEKKKGRRIANEFCGKLIKSMTDFSRDPKMLLDVRSKTGDCIEMK